MLLEDHNVLKNEQKINPLFFGKMSVFLYKNQSSKVKTTIVTSVRNVLYTAVISHNRRYNIEKTNNIGCSCTIGLLLEI